MPSYTNPVGGPGGRKEKRFKIKNCVVFQFSIRDSLISFFSSSPEKTYVIQLSNKAANTSYHSSPGVFVTLHQAYDKRKSYQTLLVNVVLIRTING